MAISFSLDLGGSFSGSVLSNALVISASIILLGTLLFIAYLSLDKKLDLQIAAAASEDGEKPDDDEFKFSDIGKLITDHSFIFISLLCVAFYSAVFPFLQYAPDLLVNKFGFTYTLPDLSGMSFFQKVGAYLQNGPKVSGLIPLGTIIFTPIFGRLVDAKGKAASLMILGSVLLIYAHLTLSVMNNVILGYTGLFALGVAFSLVPAAMWPSVAKIVAENRLGTAYATMFTIQNYGLFAFYWGIGKVLDWVNPAVVNQIDPGVSPEQISVEIDRMRVSGEIAAYNYTTPILMLVALGVISIYLAFQLKRADKRQNYGLELPSGHGH